MPKTALLQGMRIIDLTSVIFGPYATQTLADMGAEVIKIEPPQGDAYRYAGQPAKTRGMGPGYLALNHGKRAMVLDLKEQADLATAKALIAGADVFIHNIRGPAIDRLGLGYEAVKAIKSDMVYVHCVGFGSDGPYADLPAYDDVIQAASGAASLAGLVDGDPTPRYVASSLADKVAGLHGAYAVLGGLVHRLRTGEGQFIEVPMFETFTHFMLLEHLAGATFDPPTGSIGYARQLDPNRQPFPTADGHMSIVAYTDPVMVRLFSVLGAPELLDEARFATPALRATNISELYIEIAKLTPARSNADWAERLSRAQIPAMPVRGLGRMMDDPHLCDVGFFNHRLHPTEGAYFEMRPPVHFSARPEGERASPQHLGQETDSLRDLANAEASPHAHADREGD